MTSDPTAAGEVDEPVESWLPRGRRSWWAAALAALAVCAGLAVWWGLSASTGRPFFVNGGFDEVTDRSIVAIYDVHRTPGRPVSCQLAAQDEHHVIVGRTTVQVAPAQVAGTRERALIRTTTRATTAYVESCDYTD